MFRFRALGIPVTVDTWFLLGAFFIYTLAGGGRPGLFAAGAIAVFTLVHELGHAVTARRYGCEVDIRLNFLVGWASFSSAQPLSRTRRIVISLAGPFTGLAAGLATLAAIHVLIRRGGASADSIELLGDLWRGVVWAAIIISLLNLLPLWPLDGGHVVQKLLEIPLGLRRSLRAMAVGSLTGCGLLLALGVFSQGSRGTLADWRDDSVRALATGYERDFVAALWSPIAAMPGVLLQGMFLLPIISGIASMQLLAQLKSPDGELVDGRDALSMSGSSDLRYDPAALAAEREGWATGAPGNFPRGWSPSPWLRAWLHVRTGDPPGARLALATVVSRIGRWIPPDPRQPELRALVPLLPDPPPVDDLRRGLDLLAVLGVHAPALAVVRYATALYTHTPDAEVLYRAAAALVAAGEPDAAIDWLRRAVGEQPDPIRLATDPGLAPLHGRLEFQQLLAWSRQSTAPVTPR